MMSDMPEPPEVKMPSRKTIIAVLLVTGLLAASMVCISIFSLLDFLERRSLEHFLTTVQMVSVSAGVVIVLREVRFVLRTGKAPTQGIMPSPSLICFWIFIGASAIEMTRKAIATASVAFIVMSICMWIAVVAGMYVTRHYAIGPGHKAT